VMLFLALAVAKIMSAALMSRIVVPDGKFVHISLQNLTDIRSQSA
jgi:hypothetical protein